MKIFVLAAVLIILGLGVAFLFKATPAGSASTVPDAGMPLPPGTNAASTTLEPTPLDPKPDEKLADPAVAPAARTEVADGAAAVPTRTIKGRVQIAAGCGDDDHVEVFSVPFEGALEVFDWALDDASSEKSKGFLLARAPVNRDGTFEIALPETTQSAFLLVRGRYAYMRESIAVPLAANAEPVVLVAECGAAISGTVAVPSGAESLASGLQGLEVKVSTSLEGGGTDLTGFNRTDRSVHVHDGRFEIDALDPKMGYDIAMTPEKLAAASTTVTGLAAGRTKTTAIVLQRGGTLRGLVRGPDGAPVANAKVEAKRKGHFFGFDDDVVRSGTSNSSGAFELEAVWPGHVLLAATANGMLEGDPLGVDVGDGVTRTDLVVAMGAGKSIAGSVAWADGKPAADVDVNVEFDKSQMAGMTAFNARKGAKGSAKSDATGRFEVTGLGAGPFTVRIEALTPEDAATYKDADKSTREEHLQRARKDGVKPGTKDLAFVLAAPQGLRGRVVDAAAQPIGDFHVRAASVGSGLLASLGQDQVDKSVKDETGAFLLSIPHDGAWKIRVDSEGYASTNALEIKLPLAADAAPLVITLEKAAIVHGIVQDPRGTPVVGAKVTISNGDPNWKRTLSGETEISAKSTDGGAFSLAGLPSGHTSLVAESKSWAHSAEFAIDLAAGETREGVVLILREGGKLTGEVFDGGKPAAGMLVQATLLKSFDQKAGTSDGQGRFEMTHLDPGSYQIVAMPTSALAGNDDGSGIDQAALMSKLKMSSANITDGQETHVVLGAAPTDPVKVHGRVMHSGTPFTGAMVTFIAEGKNVLASMKMGTVGADGNYAVTLDGPGKFTVSVQKIGAKPGEQSSVEFRETIPAEKDHQLDFEVPTARISGLVRGADGAPAENVTVMLMSDGGVATGTLFGGQYHTTSSDGEGRFDLDALRAGAYVVSAGGSPFGGLGGGEAKFAHKSVNVHVAEGEWRKDLDLRLDKPGSVTVLVVDDQGSPVSGASVFARDEQGRLVDFLSMVTTSSDGNAKYAGLAPGRHTFSARTKDHASGESPAIDVASGETKTVRVTLTGGTMLIVRVLDSEAKPTQAYLSVTDEAGHEVATMMSMAQIQELFTSEGGSFSGEETKMGPLAPGKYHVHATSPTGKKAEKTVTLSGQAEEKVKLRLGD